MDPYKLTDDEVAAWDGMLRVHARVIRAVDECLRTDHDFNVDDFDVLATLQEASGSLRMSDLASRVVLSPSRMTRRVEALENAGYVERRPDPDDGRAVRAHLTDAGNVFMDSIAQSHHRVIRDMYLAHLNDAERRLLGELWRRMLSNQGE